MSTDFIEIGKIVAAHGLLGEVRVYPESDFPERFLEPGQRWLLRQGQKEPEPIEFLGGRFMPSKGLYIIDIAGIENRDQAEVLHGSKLFVQAGDRPHLEAGEYYLLDLIGLTVFNQLTGSNIGKVSTVIYAGNDLLEVELFTEATNISTQPENSLENSIDHVDNDADQPELEPEKKRKKVKKSPKVLIPFVNEIVPIVDLARGIIEINPPRGLID